MNRKLPLFSFGVSILWICVSTFQIINTRMKILFEWRHGVTESLTYAFLFFWIGMLAISVWSFWMSRKRRRNGIRVD